MIGSHQVKCNTIGGHIAKEWGVVARLVLSGRRKENVFRFYVCL